MPHTRKPNNTPPGSLLVRFLKGTVTIPQPETYNYAESFHWPESGKYAYPRSKLPEDVAGGVQADSWLVSPNGLTFEAGSTTGYYRMNAQEAPFMLRLSLYTGDKLLQDIAHNAVIGRYSSYPGYYYKGFAVSQLEPDFPLEGPKGATSVYYHHMPAQLGQTMDYLISEQSLKSNGSITFPSVFETNFLWFKYHLYGNKPGQFYGNSDVWLWMPKGIIQTNHPQMNWITAESGNKFYIGLSNASTAEVQTPIDSIIVDNTEAETEGVWIRDTTANDYYYENYVYAKSTASTATSRIL